jgi:aspartyl-tRNA(Asn)/glutamyl-tRNA(Gln) amidotransferase subunit A
MLNIVEAGAQLRSRRVSSLELTRACLDRIEKLNPKVNAFITVTRAEAEKAAAERDAELARGVDRGPLHGIPVAYKDLIFTKGIRTTAGSKVFENFVPDHDAKLVEDFAKAGVVMLGKTGLHELAYGITSNNPHFGAVRNPHDLERVPGGSSGGSGAAVVTDMAFMAMGSDTGGSIRIPASFCGCVGLKPTYGRVPRHGCFPLGFSLDHMGPLARTTRDCALSLEAISSLRGSVPANVAASVKGLRIGMPENYYFERTQPEVVAGVRKLADAAAWLGAEIRPVRVPDIDAINAVARVILLVEASASLSPHLHKRELFGTDVMALFDQGRMVSGIDYVNAQRLRRKYQKEFAKIWKDVDCLFAPGTPTTAPKIGQTRMVIDGVEDDVRLATTRPVRAVNALGLPVLSVPCGVDGSGLPMGLQVIGRPWDEATLVRLGSALEDAGVTVVTEARVP